ncbi:MAG: hypothetical protein IKO56_09180, partial [Alphaproteobacteria bacterium]|nr:hypothetical protein [Alphaproteobacteria bacterium]
MTLFKKTLPYFFTVTVLLSSSALASYNKSGDSHKTNKFEIVDSLSGTMEASYDIKKQIAENKAIELVANYINNAVSGAKRILDSKKKTGYLSAV